MKNMKTIPNRETVEIQQLKEMLDEVRQEVHGITEASRSLGEMVDLIAAMLDDVIRTGPVEDQTTSLYDDIERDIQRGQDIQRDNP